MLIKGFVTFLLSVLLSAGISFILNIFVLTQSNSWWFSLFIFSVLFLILLFIYNIKTDGKSYTGVLIGTISAKLLILLIVTFVYSYLYPKTMMAFSIHFIAHYILFTVFEIRYLLHIIKDKSLKKRA